MKKTLSIICIITIILLSFSGCLTFSGQLTDETTTADNSETTIETTTAQNVETSETVSQEETSYLDDVQQTLVPDVNAQENVATTAPVVHENTTALQPTETTTGASASNMSDYDILRNGVFYCKGTMVDSAGTAPMEMAFSGKSVYITTDFDGVNIGMLFNEKDMYMIYVDKKTYTEIGDTMMNYMGIDKDEMLESMDFGFSSFGDLESADEITTANVNGTTCQCYVFNNGSGTKTHIYMDGNSLKGFASADSSGNVLSANYIDYFTGDVPAYMIDPSVAYTKQNLITFMTSLMSVME